MGLRRMSTRSVTVTAAALGLLIAASALGSCGRGLLDLVAYQALSEESGMLYLGYAEAGYGVARVGVDSGAMAVLRQTVSRDNANGCALGIDPRTFETVDLGPTVYYSAETPNRIARVHFTGLGLPEDVLSTDPLERVTCLRVVEDITNAPSVFWSAGTRMHYSLSGSAGGLLDNLEFQYIGSFDVEPGPDNPVTSRPQYYRIYYLGLQKNRGEDQFGVIAINSNDTDLLSEEILYTIGRVTTSNLVLSNGYLYYVTQGPQNPNAILRIKADGSQSQPETLITPEGRPWAVAVDDESGTIYWVETGDAKSGQIMQAGAGETEGVPLLTIRKELDPNGFFFYKP